MTKPQAAAPSLPVDITDRWGLPRRPGYVRGLVRDLRYTTVASTYGDFITIDFNLFTGEGVPTIPVRMSGTDFSNRLRADTAVELPDPDPTVRPILARRLYDPWERAEILVTYYPGIDDRPGREWIRAAALVFGTLGVVLVCVVMWLLYLG